MAGRITELPALTTLADGDLSEFVDVSDTSEAGTGTNVKVTAANESVYHRTKLTNLKAGAQAGSTYAVEMGQDYADVTSDLSFMRIKAQASASNTRTSQFWGATALRVEATDINGVADGTDPYLYGVRVRMAPRVGRNNTGIDDVCGVVVVNTSFADYGAVSNGTEAVYIGHSGGATKDWNAGIGIDTIADNGIYIARGAYAYGILITGSITTAAMRIPNNSLIVSRNAADSGNVSIVKVDSSDRVTFKADALVIDASNNVLVGTTSSNLISGGRGLQIRSTDGTAVEINASADTAASATSALYAKGRSGSNDVVARVQANSAGDVRFGGESSGHNLLIRQGGATRLTLTATQFQITTDPYDIVLGTTTGTKIGTATSQKLAFWNKTPIVQPTTGITGASFTANSGTAVNDASTFGGYTLAQLAAALINTGIVA